MQVYQGTLSLGRCCLFLLCCSMGGCGLRAPLVFTAALALGAWVVPAQGQTVLLPRYASWKYSDTAAFNDAAWAAPGFVDTTWSTGGCARPLLAPCPRCDASPRVRWGNSMPKCPTTCSVVSWGTGSTIVVPPWVRKGELHVPLRARSCDPSLWCRLQAAPLWDMGSSLACPSTPPCFLSPRESQRTFGGGGWGTRDQPRGAA